jgi:hypothetical protein
MNNDKRFSEEFLNAFVDDQLTAEEKGRAYPIINQDENLNRQVCELRKMHDLVQLAYRDTPAPRRRYSVGTRKVGTAVAASFLLLVGMALGWFLHIPANEVPSDTTSAVTEQQLARTFATQSPAAGVGTAGAVASQEMKVLFHLNSGNHERMQEVLDEAENMLRLYQASGQPARVEIVANGDGINLLRADVSPYAQRISELKKKYPNLVFAACQNTLDRLALDYGIVAKLLPEASVIESGVAQIIRLQQQGWVYIQV